MQPNTKALAANRWFLVSRDMDEAIDFLRASQNLEAARGRLDNFTIDKALEALIKSSIVCYARGFLSSKSQGNASAKAEVAELALNDKQLELHTKIITLRVRAIAHSDWEHHNTQLIDVTDAGVIRSASVPQAWREIDREHFLDHAHEIRSLAYQRSFDLSRQDAGLTAVPNQSRSPSDRGEP